jgi:hypothetical protein
VSYTHVLIQFRKGGAKIIRYRSERAATEALATFIAEHPECPDEFLVARICTRYKRKVRHETKRDQ